MKKDRNTFFEGSSMNMSAFNSGMPNMMMPNMPMNASASASQSFYSNTGNPMMMPNMMPQNTNQLYNDSTMNELESRLAKLERSINRLENRINKLEGSTYYTTENYESYSSGMYMV